ncbi:MAG TPA: phasin family protein [Paenibacillus sp.]
MSDLFKKAISLGWGLTMVSKEKVEKVVDELVKRGELAPDESKALVNRLIERGEEEQSQFKSVINDQVKKILHEINVPTTSDVTNLEQRIAVLEQRISELEAPQVVQEAPQVE